MKFAIFIVLAYSILGFGIYWGMEIQYKKGFNDGYNKYIGTFIPAPYLPAEIPMKRKANLIEKFKG